MHPRPDDHFSPLADAYARGRLSYPNELFDFLRGFAPAHDLAWDCATGSGQAVPPLAERFRKVVATDISDELLRRAPRLANVTYAAATAESAPLPDHAVDLATVAQALHWFDLENFWPEVRRVLKPQGVFAFWGYTWPQVAPDVDALLDELLITLAVYWPRRTTLLHDRYAAVVPPFTAIETPEFEVTMSWDREDYLAHLESWSAVRYFRERTRIDPLPPVAQCLQALWSAAERRPVRWPLVVKAYRA